MFRYILYFLAVYVILTATLIFLNIFDILPSNLSSSFSVAIIIASTVLPASKFVKKLGRVPNIKEKLIFGFGVTFCSEIVGLVPALFFANQINLSFLKQIDAYIFIVFIFIILVKFIVAGAFFGFYAKLTLRDINRK